MKYRVPDRYGVALSRFGKRVFEPLSNRGTVMIHNGQQRGDTGFGLSHARLPARLCAPEKLYLLYYMQVTGRYMIAELEGKRPRERVG